MYRKRIFETIDNLRQDLDMILQENLVLKNALQDAEEKNNMYLVEIKKCQSFIKELGMSIKNLQKVPCLDTKTEESKLKKIKMGNDWWLAGDDFIEINLFKKYLFYNSISYCEMSNDGKFIGVAVGRSCFVIDIDKDKLLLLNEKNDQVEEAHFSNIKRPIIAEDVKLQLMFSVDSRYIITAYVDKTIIKWDLVEMKPVKKWCPDEEIVLMKVIGDKYYFMKKDHKLRIIKSGDMEETIINLNTKGVPLSLAITRNNKFVFIGMTDKRIIILDSANQERHELKLPKGVRSMDLSNDDKTLLMIATDDTVNIYTINYEKIELEQIYGPFKTRGRIMASSFFKDKRYIITAGTDLCAKIWDTKSSKYLIINGYHDNIISLSMHKKYFCTSSGDGRLKLWHYGFN